MNHRITHMVTFSLHVEKDSPEALTFPKVRVQKVKFSAPRRLDEARE